MNPDERHSAAELVEKADLMMMDGDSLEAHQLLQRAVVLDPDNAEARRLLYAMNARRGVFNGPPMAEAATVAHGAESFRLTEQAWSKMTLGHFDEAVAILHRALSLDPGNARAQNALGVARAHQTATSGPYKYWTPEPRKYQFVPKPLRAIAGFLIAYLILVSDDQKPNHTAQVHHYLFNSPIENHFDSAADVIFLLTITALVYITWGHTERRFG